MTLLCIYIDSILLPERFSLRLTPSAPVQLKATGFSRVPFTFCLSEKFRRLHRGIYILFRIIARRKGVVNSQKGKIYIKIRKNIQKEHILEKSIETSDS